MVSYSDFQNALHSQIIRPCFRFCILNSDFSISEDISEFIINDGSSSLSVNYQSGTRKTAVVVLSNIDDRFNPDANGLISTRTYFRLDLGIIINNESYFPSDNSGSIFLIKDYSLSHMLSDKRITLNLVDLYSKLDGTLLGTLATDFQIPINTPIQQAIQSVLNAAGDTSLMVFTPLYNGNTPCTIRISSGGTYHDVIAKVLDSVSAIWYYGWNNFTVESGVYDLDDSLKPSIFDFSTEQYEYLGSTITGNNSEIYNSVIVVGANSAGDIYTGVSQNTNPLSPINIERIQEHVLRIEDSVINSDILAQQRSLFELKKHLIVALTVLINCTYHPSLQVNKVCTTLFDPDLNFNRERLLIKSFSVPIATSSQISLTCSNVNEIGYSVTSV